MSTNNPYAPPRGAVRDVEAESLEPTERIQRFGAFLLAGFVNRLLGVVPLYGFIDRLFIFGERRQCIHDLIADTIVVRD